MTERTLGLCTKDIFCNLISNIGGVIIIISISFRSITNRYLSLAGKRQWKGGEDSAGVAKDEGGICEEVVHQGVQWRRQRQESNG